MRRDRIAGTGDVWALYWFSVTHHRYRLSSWFGEDQIYLPHRPGEVNALSREFFCEYDEKGPAHLCAQAELQKRNRPATPLRFRSGPNDISSVSNPDGFGAEIVGKVKEAEVGNYLAFDLGGESCRAVLGSLMNNKLQISCCIALLTYDYIPAIFMDILRYLPRDGDRYQGCVAQSRGNTESIRIDTWVWIRSFRWKGCDRNPIAYRDRKKKW